MYNNNSNDNNNNNSNSKAELHLKTNMKIILIKSDDILKKLRAIEIILYKTTNG